MYYDPTGHVAQLYWPKEDDEYEPEPEPIDWGEVWSSIKGWFSTAKTNSKNNTSKWAEGIKQTPDNKKDAVLGVYASGSNSGLQLMRLVFSSLSTDPSGTWIYWTDKMKTAQNGIQDKVSNPTVFETYHTFTDAALAADGAKGGFDFVKSCTKGGVKVPNFNIANTGTKLELAGYSVRVTSGSMDDIINFGRAKIEPVNPQIKPNAGAGKDQLKSWVKSNIAESEAARKASKFGSNQTGPGAGESFWSPNQNKNNLWSKGKLKTHYADHGVKDFGFKSAKEYSDKAVEFGTRKADDILQTTKNGYVYRYKQATQEVFVGTEKSGRIKTYYKYDGRVDDDVINTFKELGLIG